MKFTREQVLTYPCQDFESECLANMDLSGIDFQGSNLKMTILRNSKFSGANLTNLKVSGDCSGADFRGAILTNTKFAGAFLLDAIFDLNNIPELSKQQLSQIKF